MASADAASVTTTAASATGGAPPALPQPRPTTFMPPLDFPRWLRENESLLQPPVNNFCIWRSGFSVMVVGGPNRRTDYHTNPTEEWFYQYKGDMLLKIVDRDGEFKDVPIKEGEMLLLPALIPHNPVRFANTVGIVIEMQRPEGSDDSLSWFCEACHKVVYSESFYCTDLGTQLKPVIEKWAAQPALRRCGACGHENSAK